MSESLLQIKNLTAGYGDVQILRGINMNIEQGQIVALVGSNGVGKSTLLKVLSGLIDPMEGEIIFEGRDIVNENYQSRVSLGITQIPEGRLLFPDMTVEENLLMGGFLRKDKEAIQKDLDNVYTILPRLKERREQKAGSLSGGEQQMCAVGRGLMADPKLLLVDEMSLGLAPLLVDSLIDTIKAINELGKTVLLVEQDVRLALENSHRGYVLANGGIVMEGPTTELLSSEEIKEAFLGI